MRSGQSVAVVDYGMGNLRSVVRALQAVGAAPAVTSDPEVIATAARVVFPGQGAFDQCMSRLDATGMGEALQEHWKAGRPYLGICLGLQVLFEESEEHGPVRGFGVIPGRVVRFAEGMTDEDGARLKVPHMGWNTVRWERDHPIAPMDGEAEDWFYFVHSYYVTPTQPDDVLATAQHGGRFTAGTARGAMVGVQFHPEKSQAAGLDLLRRFLAM